MRLWRWQGKPELNLEIDAGGAELLCKMVPEKFFCAAENQKEGGTWGMNYNRKQLPVARNGQGDSQKVQYLTFNCLQSCDVKSSVSPKSVQPDLLACARSERVSWLEAEEENHLQSERWAGQSLNEAKVSMKM